MFEQIAVVVSITFLVMISPGPDMVIVMRSTLVGGRRAGIWTSFGVLAGNAVHMTYCVLGIGWLISKSIVAFSVLKYAGAAYFIYLGITSFRARASSLAPVDSEPPAGDRRWFVQGFISNVLNPKGTLFYLGVFTMVITPDTSLAVTLALVASMKTISATFWVVFVHILDRPLVRRLSRTVNRR